MTDCINKRFGVVSKSNGDSRVGKYRKHVSRSRHDYFRGVNARMHARTHRYVTVTVNIERHPAAAAGYAIRHRDVTLYGAGPGLDFRAAMTR